MRLPIAIVYFFILFAFSQSGIAQSEQNVDIRADSLRNALSSTKDYDKQIKLLGELSDYYSYSDSTKAMNYALHIKELATKHRDRRGMGIAHYRIGGVYFERYQVDSAIKEYNEAVKLLEKDTTFLGQQILAKSWYNLGAQHQRKNDEETFLDYILNKSIPLYERISDSLGMGKSFHNIGLIFQNNYEYERAIYYYQKSIASLRHYPHTPELVDSYCKLVESKMYFSDISKHQELEIPLRQETKRLLETADSLLRLFPDHYSQVLFQSATGMYEEILMRRLDKALLYYREGHELAVKWGFHPLSYTLLNRIYYIYDKQGKDDLALQTAKNLLEKYDNGTPNRNKLVQLRNVTNSLEKLGRTQEAYETQKKYIALNDSLHTREMAFKVHNLEQKYEAKEKEAHIMKLNQQMHEQESAAQRNRLLATWMGGAIILIVGISLAGYNIFRKKQLIVKQQSELLQQNMEKMRQEQHISVFGAMLEGQEQERKRLAQDLHDGLGGSLSGIKMKLSKVALAQKDTNANSELSKLVTQLDASVDELRRIARNMMPETLVKYGLATALQDFCQSMESDAVEISFQAYDLRKNIPRNIQIMVYRIVQELVTNAIKHAGASHILAQCLQNDQYLSITVEDDGKGLDIANMDNISGMGLSTVKNRVTYLGGKIDIQSEQRIGTTISVEINIP